MDGIKKFLRQDRDYFANNRADIDRQNEKILRLACAVYLVVLTVYTVISVVFEQSRALLYMYVFYDAFHVVLCMLVFCSPAAKRHDERFSAVCRILLELSLLSFFALEAVFPNPEQPGLYIPLPVILLTMLFVLRPKRVLTIVLSYVGAFVVLTCLHKTGAARANDLYIAASTVVASLAGYVIVASLRHETGAAIARLKSLSMLDPLTGLYNKATFESLCRSFMEEGGGQRPYALLFIDIDKFKQINDRFGHQAGDAVLQSVAKVMQGAFYDKDYLCRFGGDEFMVFMADAGDRARVSERAGAFRAKVRALSEPLKIDGLACSVGIAMKSEQKETYAELLSRADAALYAAKRAGTRQVSFAEQYFKQNAFRSTAETLDGITGTAGVASAAARSARRRVLVVDDNRINRQILAKILGTEYDVLEAEHGAEALERLRNESGEVSAVVLDIMMPVMDGYAVLEELRSDEALSRIPVIVTTGNTDEESELRALSMGANDFIVKPYRPAVIMHRVQNTINLRETAALANAAERDPLTGVYGKEGFFRRVDAVLSANPDTAYDMLCCDIEHFKLINELFGEKTGDALLKYVASLLVAETLDSGSILGRIGSDKFASLVPHRARYTNEDFVAGEKRINEFPVNIDIAVRHGIYCIDDPTVPVRTMCDRAFVACNAIKGKYGVYFAYYDDDFRQKTLQEQFILDGMKAGLAEKQFLVYYQPKYSLTTGEIVGAEALVRWLHPEKGLMPPDEFIPLFERNGFITDLDIYVWDTACQDLSRWIAAGNAPLPLSVNVSRTDLFNPALPDLLLCLVQRYGLPPALLHLEITETAYTEDSEQLVNTVQKLRALGFPIEMDDFGSGYSSLNMLSELPIDILKLDTSLVRGSAGSRKRDVLEAVTYLSKQLGLPVTAEGTETEAQVTLLKALGCSYAQGYYFARPLPREAFEQYLKEAGVAVLPQ